MKCILKSIEWILKTKLDEIHNSYKIFTMKIHEYFHVFNAWIWYKIYVFFFNFISILFIYVSSFRSITNHRFRFESIFEFSTIPPINLEMRFWIIDSATILFYSANYIKHGRSSTETGPRQTYHTFYDKRHWTLIGRLKTCAIFPRFFPMSIFSLRKFAR